MIGIESYGFYIPRYRIKMEEIARQWGKNSEDIVRSLRVFEKTVSGLDEDTLTMAFESSVMALGDVAPQIKKSIDAIFVGSETHPYTVNPTATILGEFLGISGDYLASDTEFACKAATGALISTMGLVSAGMIRKALVIAADKATGKPHDMLEYTAASGSVCLVVGAQDLVLEIVDWHSFSTDTPDFWRREGIRYPSHGGRFTGKPSYFYHIEHASRALFKKTTLSAKDFTHAIFHMPNGKFPVQVAQSLGFTKTQIQQSLVVSKLGNSYTASALMGLVAVLDKAQPGELIFFASFGSGAGSDAFVFRVTKNISKRRRNLQMVVKKRKYINYATYLKYMGVI